MASLNWTVTSTTKDEYSGRSGRLSNARIKSRVLRNGAKKIGDPPEGRKANMINMVAAAVELAGGPTAVARLCGVRRQSIYLWIKEWKVERLVDALKLSRASGIPIEKFAGQIIDTHPTKENK